MKSMATIKLKIPLNKLLLDTMKQYSKAVSYIADKGFTSGIHNRYKLHHLCYYESKDKFKQIVNKCNTGTIVLENLKGIRNTSKGRKFNFWLNGWNFYQLQNFIKYKAMQCGIRIVKVSPFRTSQTCSKCRQLGSRSKYFFVCPHCGYSLNADLNASFNLAKHHSNADDVSASVTTPNIQGNEHKGTSCAIACELMDKSPLF